ncbi:MAG TPA: methyltransferase domain-containing protein [Solirubrobacteraceae bacterium]|jgi:SAM-dependent methyltransferase|nr:methyltransferase domain-containing protein [Solirubrobacteraceae bacterium]
MTAANDVLSVEDFSEFLHALRSEELRRLPRDARTIVSGGCAAEWYFSWFNDNFGGRPERHYGVELFADAPPDLPEEVTWLRQSLGTMSGIADREADLVFAGEVIEHLWPDDIAGFLTEAWRVLKPGGVMALDSPNRIVCQAQRWTHPEHTLEFSAEEITRLLKLAGFDDVTLRGIWLCHDRDRHQALRFDDLDGEAIKREDRIRLAEARPEDAFVWWAEAVRGVRAPDIDRLRDDLAAMYAAYRPERLARLLPASRRSRWEPALGRVVSGDLGSTGVLFHGPYVPVPPGVWEACFRLALIGRHPPDPDAVVAELDVAIAGTRIAWRALTARDLFPCGSMREVCLPFDCAETRMGVEFRLIATGGAALDAPLDVTVRRFEGTRPTTPPESDPGAPIPLRQELPPLEAQLDPPSRGRSLLTWPIRRTLDPRLRLLHRRIEDVEARLTTRLEELARMLR